GNPAAFVESLHMVLAAFAATGFAVAGIHAFLLLRDRGNLFHQRALGIALLVGGIPAIILPLSGDLLTREVARDQPARFAATAAPTESSHMSARRSRCRRGVGGDVGP